MGAPSLSIPRISVTLKDVISTAGKIKSAGFIVVLSALLLSAGSGFVVLPNSTAKIAPEADVKTAIAALSGLPVTEEITADNTTELMFASANVVAATPSVYTDVVKGRMRGDISTHSVAGGETLGAISQKYGITTDSILWANGLEDANSVKPGQNLIILPVSGVLHTVQSGETAVGIAAKYKADGAKTISFNDLDSRKLEAGMQLIVPDGVKAVKAKAKVALASYYYRGGGRSDGGGWYMGYFPKQGGSFSGGYCTSYIQYRKGNIPWRGNAKEWINNSRPYAAQGSSPKVGAIYVEPWLTWAGHVSLVTEVRGDGSFVINEGNNSRYGGYQRANGRIVNPGSGGIFIYY